MFYKFLVVILANAGIQDAFVVNLKPCTLYRLQY